MGVSKMGKDKKKDKKNKDKKNKDKKDKGKKSSGLTTGQKVALGGAAAIALAGVAAVGATAIGVGGYKIYQSQQGAEQDKSPLKLRIRVVSGHNLIAADSGGTSDPYVVITEGHVSVKTDPMPKTVNPVWNQDLEMGVVEASVHSGKELKLEVFDKDMLSDDNLGRATIPLNAIPLGNPQEFNIPLTGGCKKDNQGSLKLFMHFARTGPGGPTPGGAPGEYRDQAQLGGYQGYPPQGGPPGAYGSGGPPQGAYGSMGRPPQQGYPPQGAYGSMGGPPQQGYPPQGGPPCAYGSGGPPQGYGAPQQGYPPQGGPPPQGGNSLYNF